MIEIKLTTAEILMAAQAGVMRQVENIKFKAKPTYGSPPDNAWQMNIEGCLGEFALAKHLDVWWGGKGVKRQPDVGHYDVRTASEHHYKLILHPDDPDDRIFWLLTGYNGHYQIHGWIPAKEGKVEKYWADPVGGRPAFFVPQSALYKPETIRDAA